MDRQVSLSRTEMFSFLNPWIRYFLFFFSFLFWVFSLLIVAIGVYAKAQKATDTVRDSFLIDPAVILIVVGVVMFFITFCGCIGALRENIRLLKIFSFSLTLVFLTQMAIAILGFFYSEQTRDALGEFVKKAIVHYRDDLDLQNLMDYIQKETVINSMCGFGIQTQNHLNATKSIYSVGCADRAVIWIESHLLLFGALTLGLALPQIAGIVLSQILISEIRSVM
ncbi:tetraspanin-33b isoform X2 [Danio rerio]|uniref:Tetraspanin-33b isoform X2 n=1 Tax=Danio rerio TaxID=7955 RepID=A0AB32TAF8_DANRE